MGYPTKVQCIQRKQTSQYYINFPAPIAEAMDFEKGETVEWTIHDKGHLIVSRREVPPDPVPVKKNDALSEAFDHLLEGLVPAFASPEDFARARALWLAGLLNLGRHTVTGALSTAGSQHRDWSAQYRLLQRLPVDAIFSHVQRETLAASDASRPWVVALDDSITRKTGRCIPGCGWRKDPLGPPFNINFVWGQRVLQFSAAIPATDGSARLVPVDWQEAPLPKKPSRHADLATQAAYVEARKQANINEVAAARMAHLRAATQRPIHWVSDGRFTNRTLLRRLPENTVLIGRVRKDTKLYAP